MHQSIPVGLSTQVGLAAALTAFVLALIAFIDGDRSEETIGALITGAVLIYGVVRSRGQQAAAQITAEVQELPGDPELEDLADGEPLPDDVEVEPVQPLGLSPDRPA